MGFSTQFRGRAFGDYARLIFRCSEEEQRLGMEGIKVGWVGTNTGKQTKG